MARRLPFKPHPLTGDAKPMARSTFLAAAAMAALSLAACQKKDAAPAPTDPGTGNAAVNAAQDATATAVGTAAAVTGPASTDAFVTNAAISDMYEIQAGQIAQTKGQSAEVKAFGAQMVTDHTALSNAMKPLIIKAGKTPPAGLDERRKGLIDNLNAAAPAAFDKVYITQQEAAHEEALTLMQGYADHGDDAGLKGGAAKALPKIKAHLNHVQGLVSASH
jgi:putative membrane protein